MSEEITGETSDGYHTFNELYRHRAALFATLCKVFIGMSWKTRLHHPEDGHPMFDGMFLAGIDLPNGTVTYHLEEEEWENFPHIAEIQHAPKFDGHTSNDVLATLQEWARL